MWSEHDEAVSSDAKLTITQLLNQLPVRRTDPDFLKMIDNNEVIAGTLIFKEGNVHFIISIVSGWATLCSGCFFKYKVLATMMINRMMMNARERYETFQPQMFPKYSSLSGCLNGMPRKCSQLLRS